MQVQKGGMNRPVCVFMIKVQKNQMHSKTLGFSVDMINYLQYPKYIPLDSSAVKHAPY